MMNKITIIKLIIAIITAILIGVIAFSYFKVIDLKDRFNFYTQENDKWKMEATQRINNLGQNMGVLIDVVNNLKK